MGLIDSYTLDRARKDLTQDELDFEPHPGAWGIRRRGEQRTKHIWSEANDEWVVECDRDLAIDEYEGRPVVMPMTTINWLLLKKALEKTTDEMLERDYPGHPWRRGDHALAAMLNEVSHHGRQICMVRDIYANRYGRTRQR